MTINDRLYELTNSDNFASLARVRSTPHHTPSGVHNNSRQHRHKKVFVRGMERSKQPMNAASTAVASGRPETEKAPGRRPTFSEMEPIAEEKEPKAPRRIARKHSDDLAPPEAPRGKRAAHFGDDNFAIDTVNKSVTSRLLVVDEDAVTWTEIGQSCCLHSSNEWFHIAAGFMALLACLYFFMFGMQLMGSASKVMAGCASGELFGSNSNALASLMVGIISTVLLQSSTAAVAVTVALEEAGAMSVRAGIFTIMGANIGTTITSALITLGQLRDVGELERGVAAASVHSLFNFMTVAVLFPVELCFGYLEAIAGVLVGTAETGGKEDTYVGPIKSIIQPLVDLVIMSNSKLITGVAKGKSCESYYPIECDPDFDPSFDTCKVGLISCNKETGQCPWLFREDATLFEDKLSGGFIFLLALGIIVASTMGLIVTIKFLLNGLSIVVSTLVPFAGVGALPLETVYPLVVGSNVGTALQTVMTSLSAFGAAPLQVALAHLFFNVTGFLLWYPLPQLRAIPLWGAGRLGQGARVWRLFPIVSIVVLYLVVPFVVFGLTELYLVDNVWAKAFVIFLIIAAVMGLLYIVYWCKYQDGTQKFLDFVAQLSRKRPDSIGTEPSGVSNRSTSFTQKTICINKPVANSSRSFAPYGSDSEDSDVDDSDSSESQI